MERKTPEIPLSFLKNMKSILKQSGKKAEQIVEQYYLDKGYYLLNRNYTIPGGEIDLVFESEQEVIFIEVKLVDYAQHPEYLISKKKLSFLERTIENYCYKKEVEKNIRLDIVFVKEGKIREIYENVTW